MAVRLLRLAVLVASFIVCTDAAAILLSLLKELQKQSQAINELAGISSKWCGEAEHTDLGVSQVLQGQLDDANIAVQQIKSDEKRLSSELTLASSTQKQREQQLEDATQTSSFATAEFESQRDQLNHTITACEHGIRLVKAQMQSDSEQQEQLGGADAVVNNLLQTSSDHMTDAEKNIMMQYANDPKPAQNADNSVRPQELFKTLTKLHDRLKKQQSSAFAEQQVLSLRLWSFTDHLGSSIMESKSQAAAISMEIAQRKREHSRLDGRIASLNKLLGKVSASQKAVSTVCSLDAQHAKEVEQFIAEESNSVRTTLKKMPALSTELLFDLNNVLPATNKQPSFLQLRGKKHKGKAKPKESPQQTAPSALDPIMKDLETMSNKYPQDASFFSNAQQDLLSHRADQSTEQDSDAQKPADSISTFASSSIDGIFQFLKDDDQTTPGALPGDATIQLRNSGDLKHVTGVYQNMLEHVRSQEKATDEQLKWCGSIARDAKLDADAVARSLKWSDAKLNLVHVAMSEYKRSVAFNKQQQDSITARSSQLQKFAGVEDDQLERSYNVLKQYGQQLISLATELEQKPSAEEKKGAQIVRGLLDKVEKHQGLLQSWRAEAKEHRNAVSAAFQNVAQALEDGVKQSKRRMVRLKVESQVLSSLTSSKAKDKELSERYMKLSQQLCSPKQAQQLQAKGATLREEAAAVQKTLSSLTQPSV